MSLAPTSAGIVEPRITLQELYERHRFLDPLPIPAVLRPRRTGSRAGTVRLSMVNKQVHLHSRLPPTPVWSYENPARPAPGAMLGPTIEVMSGVPVRVEWTNNLAGAMPFATAVTPYADGDTNVPQNQAGTGTGTPVEGVDALPAWTVVHLHGGLTAADSDGWTENANLAGQTQYCTYENNMDAAMLWYHDHAMGITRLNVYAGLAGVYLIRDDEERSLGLPARGYELPLVLQDRNLETDAEGKLTGILLHKTETGDGPMEFFGPCTMVNAAIWPHADVKPRQYRLRFLNGSNARTYCLALLDKSGRNVTQACLTQIGTDGGLMETAVSVPADGLLLAPGERADVIADFSIVSGNVRLVNRAACPFGGEMLDIPAPNPLPDDYLLGRVPFPDVMEFRISGTAVDEVKFTPGTALSGKPRHRWKDHSQVPHSVHRWVALVEHEGDTQDGMLYSHELIEEDPMNPFPAGAPVFEIQPQGASSPKRFMAMGGRLRDTINFFAAEGTTEVWKVVNLTFDTHPFHIHLTQFMVLGREEFLASGVVRQPGGGIGDAIQTAPGQPLMFSQERALDDNEKGLKDVVRVNPGAANAAGDLITAEILTIAVPFEGFTGRYMYHCHILEHEDMEMMRPVVVMPKAVLDQMHMGGHSH